MAPFSDERLWGLSIAPKYTSIVVFLPNGMLINLSCSKDSTLESIKNDVFNEAKKLHLYRKLKDKQFYIFSSVVENGVINEFYDESKRLCDLRLFYAFLNLILPEGNKEEKILNSNISFAIGKPLDVFESCNDPETNQFRTDITYFVDKIVKLREQSILDERLKYFYPPELDDYYYLIKKREKERLKNLNDNSNRRIAPSNDLINKLTVCIWYLNKTNQKSNDKLKQKFEIDSELMPNKLIRLFLNSFKKIDNSTNYLLKVCGIDQYLLNEQPIIRYKYIVDCISKEQIPQLVLINYDDVCSKLPQTNFILPSFLKKTQYQEKKYNKIYDQNPSLWTQTDKTLSLLIHSITYINISDMDKIFIRACLYHGTEKLCDEVDSTRIESKKLKWNECLTFDINMEDIPRNAKICLAVCGVRNSLLRNNKNKEDDIFPIKWANLQVFDYYGRLISGRSELTLFPLPEDHQGILFPLGNVNDKSSESCSLNIEFQQNKIIFPNFEDIINYAEFAKKIELEGKSYGHKNETKNRHLPQNKMNEDEEILFNELLKKDQLSPISKEDKDFLWRWRLECRSKNPESLPKLIDSVSWNNRDEVSQLYCLLENWSQIKVETALELLDCKYSDYFVRSYAVKWLEQSITDEQLYQYLLQLVQVLKYEPYFDNELTRFLLRKSLFNRKIGHYFFWHIKSEMNDPKDHSYYIRFGLILEAYCRGIGDAFLNETIRQVDAIDKLTKLSENLKLSKIDNSQKKTRYLSDQLQQSNYKEALRFFRNPLNFTIQLGDLDIDACQIMDSAKKPFWLEWNNLDPLAEECNLSKNKIIFKSGDDLRQDMLTLQVIKIINYIWRQEGFNLNMIPYTCLSTGKQVGMIEVITRAKTVMDIQKQRSIRAALQVDSKQINKWIKEKNKDNYDKAVDNFTRSCAGYCVATFVMGIGDRNPDNIMIREDGHIFHIDFGHFLGHFKTKYGINRERVSFVCPSDFLHVITKGAEYPQKTKEFEEFTELCREAYLSLRKHANLLITLFTMMLYTGIPELQSTDDIEYLRTTLQVDKTESEAINYFNVEFKEAIGGNWSTKIDWFFHIVNHGW